MQSYQTYNMLWLGHTGHNLACRRLPTIVIGEKVLGCEEAVMTVRRGWGGSEHGWTPLLTGGTVSGTAMTASLVKNLGNLVVKDSLATSVSFTAFTATEKI